MPVVRNPQYYFKEGFCWTDVNSTYLKARLKKNGVFDVLSMSLFTQTCLPDLFFVCLINSKIISLYVDNFINSTSHFQINDARQLPVVVPTQKQLYEFEKIFNLAVEIKTTDNSEQKLSKIQQQLDYLVLKLYDLV